MYQVIRGALAATGLLCLISLLTVFTLWNDPETLRESPGLATPVRSGILMPTASGGTSRTSPHIKLAKNAHVLAEDFVLESISLEVVDQPIGDVLKALQEQQGIEIWTDRPTLGDQAKLLNTKVSLTVVDLPLSTVLDRLLLPLKLDWLTERERLRITTQSAAEQHMEPRVYDVLDLVQAGFDDDTLIDLIENCVEPETWVSYRIANLIEKEGETPRPESATKDQKEKPAQLHETPVPKVAGAARKGRGRTRLHEGILVIWQTQRIQNQVEQLLDQIEVVLENDAESSRLGESIVTVAAKRSNHPLARSRRLPRSFRH